MHPYGTDSNERFVVLLGLVPFSFWAASGAEQVLKRFGLGWPAEAEFLTDPTSAAAWYLILFFLVDRLLWRRGPLRWFGIVKVPNLNGTWSGHLKSSYDEYRTEYEATLRIQQTWTRMSVRLTRGQSTSHSEAGTILVDAGPGPRLSYEYVNEPKVGQVETMAMHRGTATQVLHDEGVIRRLEGQYYTNRGRGNVGSLHFEQAK